MLAGVPLTFLPRAAGGPDEEPRVGALTMAASGGGGGEGGGGGCWDDEADAGW